MNSNKPSQQQSPTTVGGIQQLEIMATEGNQQQQYMT
jgi:hypothetical protein